LTKAFQPDETDFPLFFSSSNTIDRQHQHNSEPSFQITIQGKGIIREQEIVQEQGIIYTSSAHQPLFDIDMADRLPDQTKLRPLSPRYLSLRIVKDEFGFYSFKGPTIQAQLVEFKDSKSPRREE
jgi:hypothetical protein